MNNKELIASELAKVIDSLDQDAILNLLEQPKSSDLGDIAFPAFSLAKVERKAPQAIAADIAEKIDQSAFEKVVATGPYVNFFLDKSKISDQVIKSVIEQGRLRSTRRRSWSKHYHRPFKPKHRKTILSWSLALNRYRGCSFKHLPQNGLQHD